MSRHLIAPSDLLSLAREMRQIRPQRPEDSDQLKKLRADNLAAFERWQQRQLRTATT